MADVVVIGAGAGGLSTAMLLALDGHEVTVLERDADPPPDGVHAAWAAWTRRGVNQFRMPHFALARWRHLLDQELPTVAKALDDAGALRFRPTAALPEAVSGGVREGDERFECLTARRPVLEGAIAAAAAGTFGVHVRRGVGIRGLRTGTVPRGAVPHVTGVVTDAGEELTADLVVDCSGRRSALPRWLADIGARAPAEVRRNVGVVYYARHYRAADGGAVPALWGPLTQHYESISILTLPADNDTWSLTFVVRGTDAALRGLRDPARFDAALDLFPLAAHWRIGEPLGDVDVIAKLEDRVRRFTCDAGPLATGIVAVGDAWACTNPSLGRGLTIGLLHACVLRDLLREVRPADARAFVDRWNEVTRDEVEPWVQATMAYDGHRMAQMEAEAEGRRYEADDPAWQVATAFTNAAASDPDVLRHLLDITMLLEPAEAVAARPGALDAALVASAGLPDHPLPGPDRATLVATVTT